MTKQEFLDNLNDQLSGEVPSSVVFENVNYYRNYIDGEAGNRNTMCWIPLATRA